MKISIIVPVYNTAADGKLNFCIDSLLAQTIDDYEIIAVNDASTDNSLDILRKYEAKNPGRIRVISYPDNRHQGGARNAGMKEAKGEWIGFIDSDDWVSPDYYEKMIEKGENTGADIVASSFTTVNSHTYEAGKIIPSVTAEPGIIDDSRRKDLLFNPGSMVMKIYRRELIFSNNLSFPEGIFYEDNGASPVWMMYPKHLETVEGPLYYYYMHDTSTVHTISEARCRDRLKAMEIMLSEVKSRGFFEDFKDEFEAAFIRLYLVNTLFGYMIDCPKKSFSFVKEIKKGMLEAFPKFTDNKYYPSIPDPEQRRMIDLFLKNAFAFYVYYNALWMYRKVKKNN